MGFPALLTPGRFQPAASWLRAPARGSLQTDGSTGSAPAATGLLLIAVLFAGGGCAFGAEDYAVALPVAGSLRKPYRSQVPTHGLPCAVDSRAISARRLVAARASAWFAPNRRVHRLRAGGYGGSLQTDGSTGSAPAATGLLLIAALLAGGGCAFGAEDYAVTERVPLTGESTVGLIDWTNERFEVIAQGLPKARIAHPSQLELTARGAALALAQTGYATLFDALRLRLGTTVGQVRASRPHAQAVQELLFRNSRLAPQLEEWDASGRIFWIVGAREVPFAQLRAQLAGFAPPRGCARQRVVRSKPTGPPAPRRRLRGCCLSPPCSRAAGAHLEQRTTR